MVRPSNPKLMARVLDAVAHLGESKGSSVRDILQIIKKGSNGPNRNLTMQVQRALKHAVTAGILRHRNGRYKNAIALSTITQAPKRRYERDDDYQIVDDMPNTDDSKKSTTETHGAIHDRGKPCGCSRGKKRRGSRGRKGSRGRRKGSRRRGRRRGNYEEHQEIASDNKKSSPKQAKVREDERTHKRNSDKYSEISGSEHESRLRNRKSKPDNGSKRPTSRQEPRKEMSDKGHRRSQSRHRSQTRNETAAEDHDNQNAMDCDEDGNDNDHSGRDVDNCDTKNCGSESSL